MVLLVLVVVWMCLYLLVLALALRQDRIRRSPSVPRSREMARAAAVRMFRIYNINDIGQAHDHLRHRHR